MTRHYEPVLVVNRREGLIRSAAEPRIGVSLSAGGEHVPTRTFLPRLQEIFLKDFDSSRICRAHNRMSALRQPRSRRACTSLLSDFVKRECVIGGARHTLRTQHLPKPSTVKGPLRSDSQAMVLSSRPCCGDEFCTQVAHYACSWTWFRSRTECVVHFIKARLSRPDAVSASFNLSELGSSQLPRLREHDAPAKSLKFRAMAT